MGMSMDCLLLGRKKGLSILERHRHVCPYIVFILCPLYDFTLQIYIIYTYRLLLSSAVHAVYTRMNSPLPWLNTCFCVPVTCVFGCHCILNCVYVLKCRNTINVARQYNMCMSSQIVCVNVPMPEWNMCAHTFCMSILVVLLWHVVVSWLETEDMMQVVWVGVVAPRVI